MGYYTRYKLRVESTESDLIPEFLAECKNASYAIDAKGNPEEETKWYEHEKDLMSFSKRHPEALFILSGEGEESGDIWLKYFKNGLMQTAKAIISFESYNETKLK